MRVTLRSRRSGQRGAALLAAMLTVTMVATIAASALWQQWRDVEIETSERARVQAGWMLAGALDWSRLILREDFVSAIQAGMARNDNLSEPWAVPLQEARLSSFLAADQNNTGGSTDTDDDVFLSGAITDAQALFNLRNLVNPDNTPNPTALRALQRLFGQLNLPESQAQLIALGLAAALAGDATSAPLLPERIDELAWFGVPPSTIEALTPYATLLPAAQTTINLNTAPVPVLAAVLGVPASVAQRMVTARTNAPFQATGDARKASGSETPFDDSVVSVTTNYFEVRGRLRLQQAVVEERSLVHRPNRSVTTVWRERGALPIPLTQPALR